jgi:hypothetical protein
MLGVTGTKTTKIDDERIGLSLTKTQSKGTKIKTQNLQDQSINKFLLQ